LGKNDKDDCFLFSNNILFPTFNAPAPREENKRSWLYRIRPSVLHKPFEAETYNEDSDQVKVLPSFSQFTPEPNQVGQEESDTVIYNFALGFLIHAFVFIV
jgi:homogentisate 1,2-dioxygenase